MNAPVLTIDCVNGDVLAGEFRDSGLSGARHFLRAYEHEGQALTLTLSNGRNIKDDEEIYKILNEALTHEEGWEPQ